MRGRTTKVIVIAAAVIVAVIVTAILATSSSGAEKTISTTSTVTTTQTTVVTKTVLINSSGSSSSRSLTGGQRVYKLTFQESGACGPPAAFLEAWSVTLGNHWTEAEPSNASLPISNTSFFGSPQFVNRSTITFSVSDGTYSYNIRPENMLGPSSGNLTVKGADVVVEVNGPFFSCTTSINSST